MIKGLHTFAVLIMATVLSLPGSARSGQGQGNGHGNGGSHGKPGGSPNNTATTFTVGQVANSDDRILDATGVYNFADTTLATSGTNLMLDLRQDSRGRLTSSGTLTLEDGSSYLISPKGHLQLTGQNGGSLRIQLTGGNSVAAADGSTSRAAAQIRGTWNGSSFDLNIKVISNSEAAYTYTSTLTPVNPARGFVLEDGNSFGESKHKRSSRVVILPWGEEVVRTQQKNKGSQFAFSAKGRSFGLDLRGSVDTSGTVVDLSRAKVKVGYGVIHNSIDDTTVLPSTGTTP